MQLAKKLKYLSSAPALLFLAKSALAQEATTGATSKGGLPEAGTTELTYALFIGGVILFVVGLLKVVQTYRES